MDPKPKSPELGPKKPEQLLIKTVKGKIDDKRVVIEACVFKNKDNSLGYYVKIRGDDRSSVGGSCSCFEKTEVLDGFLNKKIEDYIRIKNETLDQIKDINKNYFGGV